jgi:hypothetical protein
MPVIPGALGEGARSASSEAASNIRAAVPSLVTPSRFRYERCARTAPVPRKPCRTMRAFTITRRTRLPYSRRSAVRNAATPPRPRRARVGLAGDRGGQLRPTWPARWAAARTCATNNFGSRSRLFLRRPSLGCKSRSSIIVPAKHSRSAAYGRRTAPCRVDGTAPNSCADLDNPAVARSARHRPLSCDPVCTRASSPGPIPYYSGCLEGVLAESRIGSRPSGTNSANPVPLSEALGCLVESASVAEGLLHFCAKSSFGAAIFFGRRCCGSSIEGPIMRSADAPPLGICGLDLGAFEAAVGEGRDWGTGPSSSGGGASGSAPIYARYRCVSSGNGRPRRK